MILVQDIHQVIARREVDFETSYREAAHSLNTDGGRFLWFAWAPHGGGEGLRGRYAVLLLRHRRSRSSPRTGAVRRLG